MLADGEMVMSTGYNGRIFNAQVVESQPFEIIWDGQILDHSQPPSSRQLATSVRRTSSCFAYRPESMAGMGRYISYSPVRTSAQQLVTTHEQTEVEIQPHMPGNPLPTGAVGVC